MKKKEINWVAEIKFVPFESEAQRDRAYREWVKAFIRGEIAARKSTRLEERTKSLNTSNDN